MNGFEPSARFTMLEQIIGSVSGQLDRLDEDDPTARPLRQHLSELTTQRDQLIHAELKDSRTTHTARLIVGLINVVIATFVVLAALIHRTGARHHSVDVGILIIGVLYALVSIWLSADTWSSLRRNRRMRAGEQP